MGGRTARETGAKIKARARFGSSTGLGTCVQEQGTGRQHHGPEDSGESLTIRSGLLSQVDPN